MHSEMGPVRQNPTRTVRTAHLCVHCRQRQLSRSKVTSRVHYICTKLLQLCADRQTHTYSHTHKDTSKTQPAAFSIADIQVIRNHNRTKSTEYRKLHGRTQRIDQAANFSRTHFHSSQFGQQQTTASQSKTCRRTTGPNACHKSCFQTPCAP